MQKTLGYLGPGLLVRGKLTGEGDLTIDGRFDGELDVTGDVQVGERGVVSAPVRAGSLTVSGDLKGDVSAAGAVAVRDGGRIVGDVRAQRVSIDDGGALHGGVEMDFDLPDELDGLLTP
jgi:cytoskeletal protein CcmA (bactofilin family)